MTGVGKEGGIMGGWEGMADEKEEEEEEEEEEEKCLSVYHDQNS